MLKKQVGGYEGDKHQHGQVVQGNNAREPAPKEPGPEGVFSTLIDFRKCLKTDDKSRNDKK